MISLVPKKFPVEEAEQLQGKHLAPQAHRRCSSLPSLIITEIRKIHNVTSRARAIQLRRLKKFCSIVHALFRIFRATRGLVQHVHFYSTAPRDPHLL